MIHDMLADLQLAKDVHEHMSLCLYSAGMAHEYNG